MRAFPHILISAPDTGGWLRFRRPRRVIVARRTDEVAQVIATAEAEQQAGACVAGFVGYEAAPAFDSAHQVRSPPASPPLAWFAIADAPPVAASVPSPNGHFCGRWRAAIKRADYLTAVADIQRRIVAGDVYQVNFTYPLRTRFAGCPLSFFAALAARQPSPWRFFAETEEWAVCSASPECFFVKQGGVLRARPMKGTRPSGPQAAVRLAASGKDRAENLMIVDMLRNDMSRLAGARRVRTEALLTVEEYPTVAQMTSTVACDTEAGLAEIFAALFPCASVTGAPKIAAMQLIAALEKEARGLYCGACGWADGRQARFNVAIRTAVINKKNGIVRYGTGSGVVADSRAVAEWRECRSKTAILTPQQPPFLLETMRAESSGVALWARHMQRLAAAAGDFDIHFKQQAAAVLVRAGCDALTAPAVLRLQLSATGKMQLQQRLLPAPAPVRACLSPTPVRADNALLGYKTTQRAAYARALAAAQADGFDDAVLQNTDGEITETCIANIAVLIDGQWRTPPLRCGLLPGVRRAALLAAGELHEAVITVAMLRRAEKIRRFNAVRGVEDMSVSDG